MNAIFEKIKRYFVYLEARRIIYKDYERDITEHTNKYIEKLRQCDTEEELIDIKYNYDIKLEKLEKRLKNIIYNLKR